MKEKISDLLIGFKIYLNNLKGDATYRCVALSPLVEGSMHISDDSIHYWKANMEIYSNVIQVISDFKNFNIL